MPAKKKTTRPRKTTSIRKAHNAHYNSVTDMANDVRGVLKSIVDKDGRYTTKEASVVGKLYSAELSRMKLQVDIHKINTSVQHGSKTAKDVLSLT